MRGIGLEGKTALVTGSGRGIGRAIARRLVEAGANVMLNDLDEALLVEAVRELGGVGAVGEADPSAALRDDNKAGVLRDDNKAARRDDNKEERERREWVRYVVGDLTDAAVPGVVVDRTVEAFGGIDAIVNNAGYCWDSVIQKTTDEQFQAMLDIHLVTPFRVLRAAAGWLREAAKREAAEGRRVMRKVVNITSIAGTDGNAGQAGYASGKAGVIGLTKAMAKEWGRYNVNVNAVGFGMIETRLVQAMDGPDAVVELGGRAIRLGVQPGLLEEAKRRCPLGRLGTPDEAAGAVLFFCSELSDYVTGEVLICGGGMHF